MDFARLRAFLAVVINQARLRFKAFGVEGLGFRVKQARVSAGRVYEGLVG